MKLEIINNTKKNFTYVDKVMLQLTGDNLNYEEPLSISQIEDDAFDRASWS